jgi:hypothetical protein
MIQGQNKKELSEVFRSRQDYLCKVIAKARELFDLLQRGEPT